MTSETLKQIVKDAMTAREAVEVQWQSLGCVVNNGVIPCPICKTNALTWHVMPNGHVHMNCSKEDCVQWIE